MKTKKKALLTVLCAAMLVVGSVFGTYAYLTDKTDAVTNTFTVGNVTITLDEAKVGNDGKALTGNEAARVQANKYQLSPSLAYDKDPTVTVAEGSEDCWLFVKFEEKNNILDEQTNAKIIKFTSTLTAENSGWTQGTGPVNQGGNGIPTDVWYRSVKKVDENRAWHLIAGDQITINENLTNENMPDQAKAPQLLYNAYAIQMAGFEGNPAGAWAKVSTNAQA